MTMDIGHEIACLKLNVVAITHRSDRRGVRRLAVTLWGFPVTVHGRASTEHLTTFTVESCAGKSGRTHRFGRALVVKGGGLSATYPEDWETNL